VVLHGEIKKKVAVRPVRRGVTVQAHQKLVTVADTGALEVRFPVLEKDRYRLKAGMAVTILPVALPDCRIAGSLRRIEGFPGPENTWQARVTFGHDDDRLLPLLKCKAVVVLADEPNALTVPTSVVFHKEGRSFCYLRGESPFGIVARTVVTGPSDGNVTVIREGLHEGEEVLLQEPTP
jgi:multidrug efflux pump subunit AcrA (membrane-fusion protein)